MSLLAKFVESLDVRINKAVFREVINPLIFNGRIADTNVLIQVNKGNMQAGKENLSIKQDAFYFIPQGQLASVKLGKTKKNPEINEDGFLKDGEPNQYLSKLSGLESWAEKKEIVTIITFEVLLYNAFPFFPLLQMPPFPIPADGEFAYLVKHIALESEQDKLGREIIIRNYMQEMVIHLFRYIDSQPHLKASIEKLHYLTDKRLVDIVHYINENLHSDLSNKSIAHIALVSEDYVGQFFKSLTNRNLQDYIEVQRLERAMELLTTIPVNIQEISKKVGFKDAAYFSRRFKMKYGLNANEVKRKKKSDYFI